MLEYLPGEYWIEAEVTQLQQMITNIAINARDAMPEGGILTIRLSRTEVKREAPTPVKALKPGKWVVIQISDTGLGIPENVLPHIFEPFYQGKSSTNRQEKGTGLGLTLTRAMVEAHGGQIRVKSRPGETVFSFKLPLT